jgi:fermentation-respiration switch protein FrsA (DUF1100 family)
MLVFAYLATPAVALVVDVRDMRKRGGRSPGPQYVATVCAGVALGASVAVLFAAFAGDRASVGQALLCGYFATSLLFMLKAFDRVLRETLLEVARRSAWLLLPAALLRVTLLFGVGLPYIMAAGLTYRPRVIPRDDPGTAYPGMEFKNVSFSAADGVKLSGWWIPAAGEKPDANGGEEGSESGPTVANSTVILCHGLGFGKASALPLLSEFATHGFNTLMFDFRANGGSGGHFTSFGALERRDVLAAVSWARRTHPRETKKLFGLGVETGGAALIGAAADGDIGQHIDAVAVYGCFCDFPALVRGTAANRFMQPFAWLFGHVGLAMANVETGADLTALSPGRDIQQIWPRPVMIISGSSDPLFPLEQARQLYESAAQPKQSLWIDGAATADLMRDAQAAQAVRKFFAQARPIPII